MPETVVPIHESRQADSRLRLSLAYAVALVAALALYLGSMAPGVLWQDSGSQQLRIITRQLRHPSGLALTHPLHHYLGRAAVSVSPFDPAATATFVSAMAGAVAVANLTLLLLILTRRVLPTAIAVAALAVSHTFWQHATHTESYTIVAALLTAEWLCLAGFATTGKGRFLVLLALFNGLGIANHLLALLATPVNAVVIAYAVRTRRLSGRAAAAAVAIWAVATAPYSGLVLATILQTGDWRGTLHSAFFGEYYASHVLNVRLPARVLALSAGYLLYNFPGLTIPLAVCGLAARTSVPSLFSRALKAELLVYLVFVVRYAIADQYTFFFPVYALLAVFSGIGLARILADAPPAFRRVVAVVSVVTVAWTPLVYTVSCRVLASRGALAAFVGRKPYRDGYRAFFIPWGAGETYAGVLNDEVRRLAGDDGLVLITDNMIQFGPLCAQALGRIPAAVKILFMEEQARPEVVASHRALLESYLRAGRPVVLVPRDRDHPVTCVPGAQWVREGDLYRLTGLSPLQ